MPTQELNGDTWTLYRNLEDNRVEYWALHVVVMNLEAGEQEEVMRIRATQNALHPEWDEVPLEFTVDGGTMDYERFIELYEEAPEPKGLKWGTTTGLEL